MDNEAQKRLQVYKGKVTGPAARKKFAAIANPNYEAPPDYKWRHDNSSSNDEDKKMGLFMNKRMKKLAFMASLKFPNYKSIP
ncbi:hypothetical protein Hanom_Chr05g00411841 [Helianthus anomalus]